MAGRRAQPPGPVPVLSLAATGHAPTDRVLTQVSSATQDLQTQARDAVTALAVLRGRVTTLEGEVSGRLLAAGIRLTGSGSGTLPAGTCMVRLRLMGQGGGGGGCQDAGGGTAGGAAGGSSGDLLEIFIGTPGTPLSSLAYTWAMGSTGGAGGAAAGGNGVNGQDSTVTINGVTYSSSGGGGGLGAVTSAAGNALPTGPTGVTTSGGINGYDPGGVGEWFAGPVWFSGAGGNHPAWGAGGPSVGGSTVGAAGAGFGAGGSGAATAGGLGNKAGGAGAPGGAIIEAFC